MGMSMEEFYQEARRRMVSRMELFNYAESCNINDAFVYKGMLESLKCLDDLYKEVNQDEVC